MGPLAIALAALGGSSLLARLRTGSWNPLGLLRGTPPPSPPPPLGSPAPPGPSTLTPAVRDAVYDLSALRVAGFGPAVPPRSIHACVRAVDPKGNTEDMQFSYDVVSITPDGRAAVLRNSLDGQPLGDLALGTVPPNGTFLARGVEHPVQPSDFASPLNFGSDSPFLRTSVSGRFVPLSPGRLDVEIPMPPQRMTNMVLP